MTVDSSEDDETSAATAAACGGGSVAPARPSGCRQGVSQGPAAVSCASRAVAGPIVWSTSNDNKHDDRRLPLHIDCNIANNNKNINVINNNGNGFV